MRAETRDEQDERVKGDERDHSALTAELERNAAHERARGRKVTVRDGKLRSEPKAPGVAAKRAGYVVRVRMTMEFAGPTDVRELLLNAFPTARVTRIREVLE